MKKGFLVTVIFVPILSVNAYIEEISIGRKSSSFSTTNWSPKSFAPKVRIHPLGEMPINENKINVDSNADGIIQREYNAWVVRHGKVRSIKRFEIFRRNFILQMEMNRRNGDFFLLNEFGDLTEEEYSSISQTRNESKRREQNEIEKTRNANVKVSIVKNLPTPRVKRRDTSKKDVFEHVRESSQNSLPGAQQAIMELEKMESAETFAYVPVQSDKHLPTHMYTSLVDETLRSIFDEKKIKGVQNLSSNSFGKIPVLASYFDILYSPMQLQDNFVLRPALLSAAVSSSSETIQNYLFQEADSEWEIYAYAIDFQDGQYHY